MGFLTGQLSTGRLVQQGRQMLVKYPAVQVSGHLRR
jgi:hypothetical protein